MPIAGRAVAVCLCIALLGAVPAASGTLAGGARYVMAPDPSVPGAVIELWFRAPADGYDGTTPGISRLAITAIAATPPAPHATPLEELVRNVGGELSINAFADIASVSATVPTTDAARVARAMTQAYFSGRVDASALQRAKSDVAIDIAAGGFDAQRTVHDLLFAQLFSSGPAHDPPSGRSVSEIGKIDLGAVARFAARAFRSRNAVMTLAGNVDSGLLASMQGPSQTWQPDPPFDSVRAAAPIPPLRISGRAEGIGYGWYGPPISQARAATALDFVADYLFNNRTGVVAREIARSGAPVDLNASFITLHDPGVMLVVLGGRATPTLRQEVLDAIGAMSKPLDARTFQAARTAFEYHTLASVEAPADLADNLGWYAVEGNGAYAPGEESQTYLHTVESLDPQFVAQTVRSYLQHPAIVELTPESAPAGSSS